MKTALLGNMKRNLWKKRAETMKKKRWMGSFLFFLGVLLLFGCHREGKKSLEITFIHGWGSTEADHEAMRKIYKEFEKQNPDIHLHMISMPSPTDVIQKTGDLLTVGEIPDVIFTAGDGRESIYKFMVEKGYALNLMPYLEKEEAFKSSISNTALEYWTTEKNELYTVSDVLLLSGGYWYNVDVFRKAGIETPPTTWEEWIETFSKIKEYGEREGKKLTPMLLDSEHVVYLTDAILSEEGEELLIELEKRELNLYRLGFLRAIVRLKELVNYVNVVNSFNYRDALASFNEGESAMYLNGVWAASLIREDLEVAYAPLPTKDGKGVSARSTGAGYILGNTGNQEKMEASIKFLKYMLSEEVAKKILEETRQVPSNPRVEITEEVAGKRLYQAIKSVNTAGKKIEVPANIWGSLKKEKYGSNMILYLDKKLSLKTLHSRMLQ